MMNPKKYVRQYFMPPVSVHEMGRERVCRSCADLVQRGSARWQSGTCCADDHWSRK